MDNQIQFAGFVLVQFDEMVSAAKRTQRQLHATAVFHWRMQRIQIDIFDEQMGAVTVVESGRYETANRFVQHLHVDVVFRQAF